MSTLETVGDYIGDARTLLQDVIAPYRYDDPSLLRAFNIMLLDARRVRADLFVYTHFQRGDRVRQYVSFGERVTMEEPFRPAMVYGIVGHALARDQEDYQDARATTFFALFYNGMTGLGATPIRGGALS